MKKSLSFIFFIHLTYFCTNLHHAYRWNHKRIKCCSDRVAIITITDVSNASTYDWVITGASFSKVTNTEYNIAFGTSDAIIKVTPINTTNGPCSGAIIIKKIVVNPSSVKPTVT